MARPIYLEEAFTRPADTVAYTSGDAISDSTSAPTVITFNGPSSNGVVVAGFGEMVSIFNTTIISSKAAAALQLELWLFNSVPTAINDNAAFSLSDPDSLKCQTVIPLTISSTTGNNGRVFSGYSRNRFRFLPQEPNIYGLLKTTQAYTPVSAETFNIQIHIDRLI